MATMTSSGAMTYKVQRAAGPGLAWKLQNNLRPAFIRGWLAYHLARPIGRTLAGAVASAGA